ncbi:N-6 DNA methylase [Weissella cibaria]|nr:N-6 DNA methylase [Weissella cibaria]
MDNNGVRSAIKTSGQELIATTYNLSCLNMRMHGVKYNDIQLRNANT